MVAKFVEFTVGEVELLRGCFIGESIRRYGKVNRSAVVYQKLTQGRCEKNEVAKLAEQDYNIDSCKTDEVTPRSW